MTKNDPENVMPLSLSPRENHIASGSLSEPSVKKGAERQEAARFILSQGGEIFQKVFHQSPISMSIDDMDGHFLLVNHSFCETMGYSEDEIYESSYTHLSHPDEAELNENLALRRDLLDGKISIGTMEKRCLHKDGHVIYTILQLNLMRDAQGQPLFFIGQILDITKRKRAEEALKQRLVELEAVDHISKLLQIAQTEQELVKTLMDEGLSLAGSFDGVIFLFHKENDTLRPAAVRGRFNALSGYDFRKDEGIIGKILQSGEMYQINDFNADPNSIILKKARIPAEYGGIFLPIRSGQEIVGMMGIALPSMTHIDEPILRLLNILMDISGNAIQRVHMHETLQQSFVELQREISSRKNIQALLAKEKEMLSISLLSIGEAVISTDRNGVITLFNHAAETITGFSSREAIGQPLSSAFRILDDQTHQVLEDPIPYLERMDALEKVFPHYMPPTLVTKKGEKYLVSGKTSFLKIRGNVAAGHILVFDNVTEKYMQQAQSTLSQKMEAIGQLAAGIAHEINTPIQYVGDNISYLKRAFSRYEEILSAYREFLEGHVGQELKADDLLALIQLNKEKKIEQYTEEVPNAIQESMDGVERVRKIVLAIREFSHPSEKEKKFSDINQGILTTITISRNEWKYVAEMETDLDETLPPVWCQIDEINQVILNMIVNAAQAIQEVLPKDSDQKGKIRVCTHSAANKAVITVQDTGGGIPEEILNRIFDPFFTTKGVGKGTGQGLSIAHNIIVKKHGGSISVASQVGEGTAFTIELPVESTSGDSQ